MTETTRAPFPARNAFTTDIEPLDAEGVALGFTGYSNGDTLTGDIDAWFHIFERESKAILTSASGLFTTSVVHGLAVGDIILVRDHTGSVNQAAKTVATVPSTKTFTLTGYSGSGTGGVFHKIMQEDGSNTAFYETRYNKYDASHANYTTNAGAKNVTRSTDYIIESWVDYSDGPQLTKIEHITVLPTYGSAP